MIQLVKRLKKEEQWMNDLVWYKKIYIRYYEDLEHPCIQYRLNLIENYSKWSIMDYIKHSFAMIKWFFSGKGWHGL